MGSTEQCVEASRRVSSNECTLYVTTFGKPNVNSNNKERKNLLFILDATTLADKAPPVLIAGDADNGGGGIANGFTRPYQKLRAGLGLLTDADGRKAIVISFSINGEWVDGPGHGFVVAYDVRGLNREPGFMPTPAIWNVTPGGGAGGVWMSGSGPAIEGNNMYLATGNGWILAREEQVQRSAVPVVHDDLIIIRRGLTGQAMKQYWCGGRPYGYRLKPILDVNQRDAYGNPSRIGTVLEIDKAQADIVREIFESFARGISYFAIACSLNEREVPSPGSSWRRRVRRCRDGSAVPCGSYSAIRSIQDTFDGTSRSSSEIQTLVVQTT
jgi:hypothetical protein